MEITAIVWAKRNTFESSVGSSGKGQRCGNPLALFVLFGMSYMSIGSASAALATFATFPGQSVDLDVEARRKGHVIAGHGIRMQRDWKPRRAPNVPRVGSTISRQSLSLGLQNVALAGSLVSIGILSLSLQRYNAIARSLLVACFRCIAQLYLAGGVLLTYLLSTSHPAVVWSWIFFTGLFATREATARVDYIYPKLFKHMALGILISLFSTLLLTLFLNILTPSPWWSPRTWIPISGMILGNSVTASALSASKITTALATEQQELELRLVRGASWQEALRSFLFEEDGFIVCFCSWNVLFCFCRLVWRGVFFF